MNLDKVPISDIITLDDVGKRIRCYDKGLYFTDTIKPFVVMGIRAPNGDTAFIFDNPKDPILTKQKCEAIKSFMDGHSIKWLKRKGPR